MKRLLDLAEAGRLPASLVSATTLRDLQTPFDAGILVRRRRGGGEVLEVQDPDAFRAWLLSRFPGIFQGAQASSPRASNIAQRRDSKGGARGLDTFPVLARAHRAVPGPDQGDLALIHQATARWGAVALLLGASGEGPQLPVGLRVMTVENPECFYQSQYLGDAADLFLLCGTGGRMREAFLHWLAQQPGTQVLHFGDYDPVGLQEYTRLLARMPGRVALYLPDNLEACFQRFSNRRILDATPNQAVASHLPKGLNPDLDRVLDLIARYGPLEQEALLITLQNSRSEF